jgi:hypothetical protein
MEARPSLVVRCHEVPRPDRPGWGCLLVHVPPMVDDDPIPGGERQLGHLLPDTSS